MTIELKSYRTSHGTRTALVDAKRAWCHVLMMDGPLTLKRVPITDQQFMTPLEHMGRPYPISRAIRVFRNYGRAHGISRSARLFLTEASQ